MALANLDLDRLKAKILDAYKKDDPILNKFRGYARDIKARIKPLRSYATNAVAFVSADGGDNRISFNPATIELVRVMDSRGNECVLDAIGSTSTTTDLDDRVLPDSPRGINPLKRLAADLNMKPSGMSYLLKGMGVEGKSTGAMRCYRDIVEWAVLYDLTTNPNTQWGTDTILVRDGLLRTKSFKTTVFPEIDKLLRAGCERHADRNVQLSIVGVAKQSAVLGKLALALELEATFDKDFPCYVEVPKNIEADCYNFDKTWLTTYETAEPGEDGNYRYQSLGQMYLVKFGDRPLDPVWPVDVAKWQGPNVEKILGQLTVDAQQGFPIPDYPMCIQQAHDFAKMTGLEMDVLNQLMYEGVAEGLNEVERERLVRFRHLNKSLTAARYKE